MTMTARSLYIGIAALCVAAFFVVLMPRDEAPPAKVIAEPNLFPFVRAIEPVAPAANPVARPAASLLPEPPAPGPGSEAELNAAYERDAQARVEISQNPSLSDEQKQEQFVALDAAMPPALRELTEIRSQIVRLKEAPVKLDIEGEEDIYRMSNVANAPGMEATAGSR